MAFHEVLFPTAISRGAHGGPERRTDVVVLGSGHEERNSRWAHSRRSYNAGYGVKSLDDLHAVIAFFEERRGRLYGFRWRDHADWKSCPPEQTPSALDQVIGSGNGTTSSFQLKKAYGSLYAPWSRDIKKPVAGRCWSRSTASRRPSASPSPSIRPPAASNFSAGTFPRPGRR
jgi:uncharacterized protein (TIGR02217 family)